MGHGLLSLNMFALRSYVSRSFVIGREMTNQFETYQNDPRNFCSVHLCYQEAAGAVASHADGLRGSSRLPPPLMGKERVTGQVPRPETARKICPIENETMAKILTVS